MTSTRSSTSPSAAPAPPSARSTTAPSAPTSPTSRSSARSSRPYAEADHRRQGDRGRGGHQPHRGGPPARPRGAALLLSPRALDRRPVPAVHGGHREDAAPDHRLQHDGGRRDGGPHRYGAGARHAPVDHGIPPDQPPARLPGVRSGR